MKNKSNALIISLLIFLSLIITSCEDNEIVGKPVSTVIPNANFSVKADKFQAGQKIEFTDLSEDPDGFITAWEWDFGDSQTSSDQSPDHFYQLGGNYSVKLIAIDNTGSESEVFSKEVVVADDPLANIDAPETLWSFDLDGKLNHSNPAVSDDGTVYIGFNQAIRENQGPDFFAIKDGAKVWEQVFIEGSAQKSDQIRSSPSIGPNGNLYTSSYYSRTTFVLNPATGVIDNEINLNARVRYNCPTFGTDGSVYIAGHNKDGRGFHSVNQSLTTANWVFQSGSEFNATPAIGTDGTIYVGSTNDNFYAINPDGTEKWSINYGTWTASATAIGPDGTIYFSGETSTGGVLLAINPNGSIKWQKDLPAKAAQGGPAVAADGTIYLGGYEEKMIAYNPDGSEKWSYSAKGAIEVVPAIDNDGNLYFGDTNGFFHVVNSDGLNPYKVTKLGDEIHSSAAIGSNGIIYLAVNQGDFGKVYALKTNATGLQSGGWPMYAKDAKHTGR
ncbi:outer membrane protein assembly factor BamB family protein [Polaribacter septentrionalilitoris]|uniref:outer membrane protein assembly factor BamB family protein n=1 Tax=Polaribacter septentrionalilitoris TaxID=2494657 RepID=UPI0013588943|nr:PQQ-binding-like beta-propeller repeat protein [Polaribacter septentrionalilitoris]